MSELLKNWVRDIFIVVTALSFAEIILPQGNMKKFLKFVFSIIILGVVLAPAAYISNIEFPVETFAGEYFGDESADENIDKSTDDSAGEGAAEGAAGGADKEKIQANAGNKISENPTSELEETQSIQLERIYKEMISAEVSSVLDEYYPNLKIYSIEVFVDNDNGVKNEKDLASLNKVVIKGEESEYVNNVVRCVSQRLGVEDGRIEYVGLEANTDDE